MKRDVTLSTTTARDILRRARRQQRLTQSELAERAGVSQTVVARYESGQRQPTTPALERLVAACGYQLEWNLRHADDPPAAGTTGAASGLRLPGPIGRRLTARLDDVLAVLAALGATEPRLHGGVADGTEGPQCGVVIGVTLPPGANPVSVIAASGHLALLLDADVRVVPHAGLAAYGYDDEGVPLVRAA